MLIGELRIWFGILKSLNTNRYPEAKFYYVSSSNHSIPFILEAAVKQYIENKHFYYLLNIMKRSSPAFSEKKIKIPRNKHHMSMLTWPAMQLNEYASAKNTKVSPWKFL